MSMFGTCAVLFIVFMFVFISFLKENADQEACCWRNLFSCINLVRILQKLTKWKHSRTMVWLRFIFVFLFVRTTLCSLINNTTGKYCFIASFEWPHFRISSTDSKVRSTLYGIINSITGKYTAQLLSFEWSHFRISSTDSKVRTTLYSIINSTTGKCCSVPFI